MNTDEGLDFSLLLASSVHDIKNSLGMLLSSLDDMIVESNENSLAVGVLRGEAARINNALIHLLGLYRLQHKQLNVSVGEVFVRDFLDEQVASQQPLFDLKSISVELDCDDNLTGYFDEQLIAGVVNNVLVNGAKYTKDFIRLSSRRDHSGIRIVIQDNGSGYPSGLLESLDNSKRGVDFISGSTNLGLYFAEQIVQRHVCKDQRGHIHVTNNAEGGCFSLYLP